MPQIRSIWGAQKCSLDFIGHDHDCHHFAFYWSLVTMSIDWIPNRPRCAKQYPRLQLVANEHGCQVPGALYESLAIFRQVTNDTNSDGIACAEQTSGLNWTHGRTSASARKTRVNYFIKSSRVAWDAYNAHVSCVIPKRVIPKPGLLGIFVELVPTITE